jgi:hypothetical protein
VNFDCLTIDDRSVKTDSSVSNTDLSNNMMSLTTNKEDPEVGGGLKKAGLSSLASQGSVKNEAEAKSKLEEMKNSNSISSQALFSNNISYPASFFSFTLYFLWI